MGYEFKHVRPLDLSNIARVASCLGQGALFHEDQVSDPLDFIERGTSWWDQEIAGRMCVCECECCGGWHEFE